MRHIPLFLNDSNKKGQWISRAAIASTAITLALSPTAFAHQSPAGCNSNRFNVSIIKDRTEVYQGQTLTYTVTASNVNTGSDITCDITDATIEITLPGMDGTPTGQVVQLAEHVSFLAGTSVTQIGSVPYVVNVNPGITDVVAQVSGNGVLHDAPVDHSALIVKTIGTTVVEAPEPPEEPEEPEVPTSPEEPETPVSGEPGVRLAAPTVAVPKLPNTGTR